MQWLSLTQIILLNNNRFSIFVFCERIVCYVEIRYLFHWSSLWKSTTIFTNMTFLILFLLVLLCFLCFNGENDQVGYGILTQQISSDKLSLFKPRIGKVISGQTTGRFNVITPKKKRVISLMAANQKKWFTGYMASLNTKRHSHKLPGLRFGTKIRPVY